MTRVNKICSMILSNLGFSNETLASLIEKWRFFVIECEGGYQWDYSEYRNEIRVRYLIQQLLNNEEISTANEFQNLLAELESLDQKFRKLLQPNVLLEKGESWWDKGVLIKAGQEYRQYMHNAHRISVKCIDS